MTISDERKVLRKNKRALRRAQAVSNVQYRTAAGNRLFRHVKRSQELRQEKVTFAELVNQYVAFPDEFANTESVHYHAQIAADIKRTQDTYYSQVKTIVHDLVRKLDTSNAGLDNLIGTLRTMKNDLSPANYLVPTRLYVSTFFAKRVHEKVLDGYIAEYTAIRSALK